MFWILTSNSYLEEILALNSEFWKETFGTPIKKYITVLVKNKDFSGISPRDSKQRVMAISDKIKQFKIYFGNVLKYKYCEECRKIKIQSLSTRENQLSICKQTLKLLCLDNIFFKLVKIRIRTGNIKKIFHLLSVFIPPKYEECLL